ELEWACRVEVAGCDPGGQVPGREHARTDEGAVARAVEDAKLVGEPGRGQDVQVSASVQVGGRDLPRVASNAVGRCGGEGPVTAAEPDGQVGLPRAQRGNVCLAVTVEVGREHSDRSLPSRIGRWGED